MTKLKTILNKLNLNPDITEAMENINIGTDIYTDYHYETINNKKFLVITGNHKTEHGTMSQEIVIDTKDKKVNAYAYGPDDPEKNGIPVATYYDSEGDIVGI